MSFTDENYTGQAHQWAELVDSNPTEREISDFVLGVLGCYFKVDREVCGYHPAGEKRFRIDAVISNKDLIGPYAFGIEFKSTKEAKETDQIMRQCAKYIDTSWSGFGRLPVFACPDPFDTLIHTPRDWIKNLCAAAYRTTDRYWMGGLRFCPTNGAMLALPCGLAWSEAQSITDSGRKVSNVRRGLAA